MKQDLLNKVRGLITHLLKQTTSKVASEEISPDDMFQSRLSLRYPYSIPIVERGFSLPEGSARVAHPKWKSSGEGVSEYGVSSGRTRKQRGNHPLITRRSLLPACYKAVAAMLMLMIVGIGSAWGDDEVYKSTVFSSDNNSQGVSSYTASWSNTTDGFTVNIENGNNNNNGWSYIKMGRKNNASTGTIITSAAIDKKVTKVTLTIDAITTSNITSIKLYKSTNASSWTELGDFDKSTGTKECSIASANQATNLYYKIEIVCTSGSSNGLIQISGISFYVEKAAAVAQTVYFHTTGTSTSTPITETAANAGVTPPVMSTPCDGWAFQGWSTSYSTSSTSTTELSMVTVTAGKYYPSSADVHLYPVYTKTIAGGMVFDKYELVTSAPTDWTANKYVYATGNAGTGKVLTGKSGNNTYGGYADMSATTEMTSYEITVETTATSGSYKLKQNGKYISLTSFSNRLDFSDSYTAQSTSVNNCDWKFYYQSNTGYVIESPVKDGNSWRIIQFNSDRFACYTSSQTKAYLYKRVEKSGSTTYYYSYPSCCTSLGAINGSVNLS
ncbi:MAG: hypothetical protein IJ776_10030, partial [Paludibacteraceae bacterium]|nr:hypothetical protein [Paludibacteraceae bacterium]